MTAFIYDRFIVQLGGLLNANTLRMNHELNDMPTAQTILSR